MSGHEPGLLPSETLERLVQLLRAFEAAPAAADTEGHEADEAHGCIRQHMLLGFRCEFLNMLRGEEQRLSPEVRARLAALQDTHAQYTATAVVDRYACVHMVQLYNDLRAQHKKHEILCSELAEFDAELADLTAQRDALRAESQDLRAECEKQHTLTRDAQKRLEDTHAEAQEQCRALNKGRQQQKKMERVLAEQNARSEKLNLEIDLACKQQVREKALLCHETGLPALEQAVLELEKVLEETPLHTMVAYQALCDIDGSALQH